MKSNQRPSGTISCVTVAYEKKKKKKGDGWNRDGETMVTAVHALLSWPGEATSFTLHLHMGAY